MTPGIRKVLAGLIIGFNGKPVIFAAASVAAAGSNQSGATLLTGTMNEVTGADGTKGVKLPVIARPGHSVTVYNAHASNALKVYPNSSATIAGGSANAAITLNALTTARFTASSTTNWAQ